MPGVLLVADRSESVIQGGQPPAQMAAWLLSYDPAVGESALSVCAAFADVHGFPVGTVARIVDLGSDPVSVLAYQLTSRWAEVAT